MRQALIEEFIPERLDVFIVFALFRNITASVLVDVRGIFDPASIHLPLFAFSSSRSIWSLPSISRPSRRLCPQLSSLGCHQSRLSCQRVQEILTAFERYAPVSDRWSRSSFVSFLRCRRLRSLCVGLGWGGDIRSH